MSVGTMTLHRFNGEEVFAVDSATIEHYKDEDGLYAVTLRAEACGPPLRSLPDTESLHAEPFAEVTLHLPKPPAAALMPGRMFSLPKGYDERTREYHTNFYYCEHEPMDDNEVVILKRDGLKIRARLTGTTMDVNFYDGSKPATKVAVEADFTLEL